MPGHEMPLHTLRPGSVRHLTRVRSRMERGIADDRFGNFCRGLEIAKSIGDFPGALDGYVATRLASHQAGLSAGPHIALRPRGVFDERGQNLAIGLILPPGVPVGTFAGVANGDPGGQSAGPLFGHSRCWQDEPYFARGCNPVGQGEIAATCPRKLTFDPGQSLANERFFADFGEKQSIDQKGMHKAGESRLA